MWPLCTGVLIIIQACVCQTAYPTSYKYILADLVRCKTEAPDILIWVQGRATSPHLRSMLRDTIGNQRLWPDGITVLIVFFTGRLARRDRKYQPLLEYEFELYRDIVQNDYIESYKNQTYKLMSAITYISDHCSDIKLVIRMDDDVLFHPSLMLGKLIDQLSISKSKPTKRMLTLRTRLKSIRPNTLACSLIPNFSVWRVKDHPKHFNAVDDDVLPGEVWYPPFCAGFFIAMSGDVPRLLKPHIASNKPFWMDDRYMGVLQKYASTNSINIQPMLDFGYGHITRESLDNMTKSNTLARHMPRNLELHISQLFEYLELQSIGLKDHFETIKYSKK